MVFGLFTVLVYFGGIFKTVFQLYKGKKCLYINKELKKEFQTCSRLRYLKIAFLTSDFFKSLGIVLLRGRLELQLTVLIALQFMPMFLWISSWKLFILESKMESLFLFCRELFNLVTFIQAIESNNLFLALLYFQIILALVQTLYSLIDFIFNCFKKKESKNFEPDLLNTPQKKDNQAIFVPSKEVDKKQVKKKLSTKVVDLNKKYVKSLTNRVYRRNSPRKNQLIMSNKTNYTRKMLYNKNVNLNANKKYFSKIYKNHSRKQVNVEIEEKPEEF